MPSTAAPEVDMLLSLIILCEVAFWVLLLSGLLARYLLNRPRVSTVLLVATPVVDVILLIATTTDLTWNAATATFAHGLAAAYIGFTIAFGKETIRWADSWFAYRFTSSPRPKGIPAGGWELVRYDFKLFGRAVVACLIAGVLIAAAIYVVDDPERTEELLKWPRYLTFTVIIWFLTGPIYSLLFKRKAPAA
jgi:hypothetical protein